MTGPLDWFDEEANGDPDSTLGEDPDDGFEEMADWPEEAGLDDGFDDAGEGEGDEEEDGDGDDEEGDEDE